MPSLSSSPRSFAILLAAALALTIAGCGPTPSTPDQADRAEPGAPASQAEASASDETGGAVPVIASDETTFEFGTVAPSESVTHVFKLQNRGTADLHIEQVKRT